MIRTGRKIALVLLPSFTLISAVLVNFFSEISWIEWIFKICLSGTVGIGTNYIAIKMLFRPHVETSLGRQGLIPKRRNEIAEGIANAVSKQLLDTDSIILYLDENNLIQKAALGMMELAHKWLDNPANRFKIIGVIGRYIQNEGAEKAAKIFSKVSEIIKNNLTENLSSEQIWFFVKCEIEKELQKPDTLFLFTELAKKLVQKNSSLIAEFINKMLDDWIASQAVLVKWMVKIGKNVFSIDRNKIEKELLKKVNSTSFSEDLIDLLSDNLESITALADNEAVKEKFGVLVSNQKLRLNYWLKTKGVELARKKLLDFLESESFWNWLEKYIDSNITKIRKIVEEKTRSEEFKEVARKVVKNYAYKIDIKEMVQRKVNEFELNELEKLIIEVSGESLAGIELFGGILGMIAGLILISQWFVLLLVLLAGGIWVFEKAIPGKHL